MRVLYVTLGVLLADQLSKFVVKGFPFPLSSLGHGGMSYGESILIFDNWLKLTFIENPNMAFGFEFGGKIFLTVFAILASIGIVLYLYRHRKGAFLMRIALALILAGALGNLIDRVFYGVLYGYGPLFRGNVVDFIDFDLYTLRIGASGFKIWPIFNVADSAVTIGVLLLFFFVRPKAPDVVEVAASADAPPPAVRMPVEAEPASVHPAAMPAVHPEPPSHPGPREAV